MVSGKAFGEPKFQLLRFFTQMGKLAIVCYCLVVFLAVFITEFSLKKWEFWFRPSFLLGRISYYVSKFFLDLGELFARLSSFLTLIEFEELLETFCDLVSPTIEIVLSPFFFCIGYLRVAHDFIYKRPILIYVGSGIIVTVVVAILVVVCRKYSIVEKIRNQWRKRFPKKQVVEEKVPVETQQLS